MGTSFFANLQLLELLAFFSGYPLFYAIIFFINDRRKNKSTRNSSLVLLLPFSYALLGSLYLGLQLKNIYPDYSFENLKQFIHQPFLISWGILSLVFWIPVMGKRPWFSLVHSLVFFIILVKDVFIYSSASLSDNSMVKNEMKMYTASLLINLAAFSFINILFYLITIFRKRQS